MSLVYRMPSMGRAIDVATILQVNQVDAREELRSCQPCLVVEGQSPHADAAVRRIEPQAELILS